LTCGFANLDVEVLAGLVLADHRAHLDADLARTVEPSCLDTGKGEASSFSVTASSSPRVRQPHWGQSGPHRR
jgi:hypothetical protein